MTIFEAAKKYKNTEGLYCIAFKSLNKLYGKLGYAGAGSKDYSRLQSYPASVQFLDFFPGHYWDKDVHKTLEARGHAKFLSSVLLLNDSEWTEISDTESWKTNCEQAIQITYNTQDTFYNLKLPNYDFDSLQKVCIEKAFEDLSTKGKHLIHAETGAGKTPMFYGVLNKFTPKDILIITWKPNVIDEFKKYVKGDGHGFLPWRWIYDSFVWCESLKELTEAKLTNKHRIVAISAYKMMANEYSSESKLNWIFSVKWDCLGLDEVHYGAWSMEHFADEDFEDEVISGSSAQKFFAKIKFKMLFALSASPYPNMAFSSFWKGAISQLTFVQQHELKDAVLAGTNTNPCDARYAFLPERHYWIHPVDDKITKLSLEHGLTDFSIQSLFIDPELRSAAKQTLRTLRVGGIGDDDPLGETDMFTPFTGLETRDHVIMRQNRTIATDTVFDLMSKDTFYDEYKFTKNYDRNKLNETFKNHKAMFVTTGGNMTGWDMSSLNKLIYTCEPHSPTQLMQDIGRIVRIDKNKPRADVIFMTSQLKIDYIVATLAKGWCSIKPENETNETWIQKNLKYSKIALYGTQWELLDWRYINNCINRQYIENMSNGKLEKPLVDLVWLAKMNNLGIQSNKHSNLTFGKNQLKHGASTQKYGQKRSKNSSKKAESNYEDNCLEALKISSLLIMFVARHYKKYVTVKEIFDNETDITQISSGIAKSWEGLKSHIDYDELQKMVNTGVIGKMKLDYEGSYQTVHEDLVPRFREIINAVFGLK